MGEQAHLLQGLEAGTMRKEVSISPQRHPSHPRSLAPSLPPPIIKATPAATTRYPPL